MCARAQGVIHSMGTRHISFTFISMPNFRASNLTYVLPDFLGRGSDPLKVGPMLPGPYGLHSFSRIR